MSPKRVGGKAQNQDKRRTKLIMLMC
uniref:Uncharacterized protein n=1 Tax=Arundo donax TaxID=35708 RepID=A0A0A8ZCN9_ARUDO